jgi:CDP-paratose 2-epimerase
VAVATIPVLFWEAFKLVEKYSGKTQVYSYVDENRIGDHICYISDLSKMRAHYPNWDITVSLEETIRQIVEKQLEKA